MKKENILLIALIGIAVLGTWGYLNIGPGGFQDESVQTQAANVNAEKSSSKQGNGIDFKSYFEGVSLAKTQGKPIFLYFHADW